MISPKILVLVGLPGSGATYLAENKYVLMGYRLLDKPSPSELEAQLGTELDLVLVDPHLCDQENRLAAVKLFQGHGYQIEFIFFENDPEKCKRNLAHRNDGCIINNFEIFNYTIPKWLRPLKIWQPCDWKN